MSIIDVSLGYHNLKLDKQSSYLTTFACPFGRYRYKCIYCLEQHQPGDMFQCKIDKIFNDMPNVFGITDDILVIGYDKDGTDHDKAVIQSAKAVPRCKSKTNQRKMSFQVHINTILWRGSVKTGCPTRPTKGQSTDRNDGTQKQKGTTGLSRCN